MKIIKTEQYVQKESGLFDMFKSKPAVNNQNNAKIDYSAISTIKTQIDKLVTQYNMAKTRRDFAAMQQIQAKIEALRQREHDILDSQYANFQNA